MPTYFWHLLKHQPELNKVRVFDPAVTNVVWVHEHSAWVTASDDSTLRMWDADGRADNMIKVYP